MSTSPRPDTPDPAGVPPGMTPASAIVPMLRLQDLPRVLSCSLTTVERMIRSGRLPRPDLVIGRKSPRWSVDTIKAWIARGGRTS